jgi:nitroreductase
MSKDAKPGPNRETPAAGSSWLSRMFRRLNRNPGLRAKLRYGLLPGAFDREHRAVLAGIKRYHENERGQEVNRYLLRRNTHRLEKGLLMRPRRDLFALDYIEATLEVFDQATVRCRADESDADRLEWQWAHDVLAEFFAVTGSHPLLDRLRERFGNLNTGHLEGGESKPYHRDLGDLPPVSYDQMAALAKQRRSVRWYLPEPVDRDLVDRAILVAAQAPSACNRQPFTFRIFDDPNRVSALAELPMGTAGFGHNIPMIVAVVGRLRAYFTPRDRHLIYIDGSLAAMSLMFALETLGLSSCSLNWPDIWVREKKISQLLNLDPDERVVLLLSIGVPDPEGLVAYSQKKTLDQLRTYNQ